jgi:phosphatidylethanolamine/phosphatidyl-N-methylethanolamine N-methyltransferase
VLHQPLIRAVSQLPVPAGARVLEVGVGTGLSLPLYPRHSRVTGIDLSEAMLALAQKQKSREGLENVELRRMDACHMDFADDSFDWVVAAYVVAAVPDYRSVIGEIIRVCRPGGRVIILSHFRNGNVVLGSIEKAISPLCRQIGFRTDLSVDDLLADTPLQVLRKKNMHPLGFVRLVECVNAKGEGRERAQYAA